MKIKTTRADYEKVIQMKGFRHDQPKKPGMFFRTLLKVLSSGELKQVGFRYEKIGMERLGADEPCLFLMNHSSFIDLKIAATILYPRPFNIVCTYDGFIGKNGLMRMIGCIPTMKFSSDPLLIRHMLYATKRLNSSILMYPEASYSFDGTATPLPESLGKCLKLLNVPVVMIRTEGAFLRDPLYNGLQLRKTAVSARMEYILSPEDIRTKGVDELNAILKNRFEYDHFADQKSKGVRITESFRADMLHRVLYKCPDCMKEGKMLGKGITLKCERCGKEYEMTELGALKPLNGGKGNAHIPDWYKWQRECVRAELEDGSYHMETPVQIGMMVNTERIYFVGEGILTHTNEGFRLTGCDGKIDYKRKPEESYSLYSDFYWYEIGDMICIGDAKRQYYCFPKDSKFPVAKARLATEELYKTRMEKKQE